MASKKTEMLSIITIKPSTPTPSHRRIFKISLFDQLSSDHYVNLTFFDPKNKDDSEQQQQQHDDAFNATGSYHSKNSKLLQKALSETLTIFYPLAGRFQDGSTIDCSDEGVVYMESKTDHLLPDILSSPDFDLIYSEFVSMNYHEAMKMKNVSMLHFNFIQFRCGGTAVSVEAAHKVFVMASIMTFLKSVTAVCRGSVEPIVPDFQTVPTLFPSREIPKFGPIGGLLKVSARSFVFTASKIQELRSIAADRFKKEGHEFGYLSRVNVVLAFLWQCLEIVFKTHRGFFIPSVLSQAANLRNRIGQPFLTSNTMGNLSFSSATDKVEKESDVQFTEMLKKMLELKVSMTKRPKSSTLMKWFESSLWCLKLV